MQGILICELHQIAYGKQKLSFLLYTKQISYGPNRPGSWQLRSELH